MRQRSLRRVIEMAALAAAYFIGAHAGLQLAAVNKNVTAVWPPTGIAVAGLCLWGISAWPGVAVGALLANLDNGAGWATSLGITVGNTLAPLAAAFLLTRRFRFHPQLDRKSDVAVLMGFGGALCMLISATLGTTALLITTSLPVSQYWSTWLVWWVGDGVGVILFAPALLTTASIPWRKNPAFARPVEAIAYLVVLAVGSWILLVNSFPLRSLAFPLVVWAAVRFRQQMTAVAVLVVTAISIGTAILDPSTLPALSSTERLLALDLFGAAIAVSAQILAAVEAERVQVQQALQEAATVLEARVQERTRELATANQELEEARRAAESASTAKSEYLSRMSHELRTPLTAIIGFAELMKLEHNDRAEDVQLHSILKAADRLEALVNDALDISRIESGRLDLTMEPVDLPSICEEAITLIAAADHGHEVEVKSTFPEKGSVVVADAQRLAQVVTNLISNGFKYGGGSIDLSVTHINGRVRLDVADRGQGLMPAQLEALFQPFERVGAERTGIRGTGLGLALSKLLVESMGGAIGVESEFGSGSTFWIELNAAEPESNGHPLRGRRPSLKLIDETEEKLILSIDDNPIVVSLLNGIIDLRPRMRMVSVPTGSQAFQAVLDNQPDMVLLDLHLPDMDGEEVLHQLKKDPRTRAIPVVILSADAISERMQKLLNAGAEAYVTKPIRISTFLRLLDETLAKASKSRASI